MSLLVCGAQENGFPGRVLPLCKVQDGCWAEGKLLGGEWDQPESRACRINSSPELAEGSAAPNLCRGDAKKETAVSVGILCSPCTDWVWQGCPRHAGWEAPGHPPSASLGLLEAHGKSEAGAGRGELS